MSQKKVPTDGCDFCGRKVVSLTAVCGFHKICVSCNVNQKATSVCSACENEPLEDENSDLYGNNEDIEELLKPDENRKPSWLTSGTIPKRRVRTVSSYMQTLSVELPSCDDTETTTLPDPETISPPAPENTTATASDADLSDSIDSSEAPPLKEVSVHRGRKPRRLRGQIASQMHSKPEIKPAPKEDTKKETTDAAIGTDAEQYSGASVQGPGVAGWRAKTPGAIMYSELRGIPTMYDQRQHRVPWEFQSFFNLGERCAIMWREQTGHSPPGDDPLENDRVDRGFGDVTQPGSDDDDDEFNIDYMEFDGSEESGDDYDDSNVSSQSERENNTSPSKSQRIQYDRSWVVPSSGDLHVDDDPDYSSSDDLEAIEGPGFHGDADDDEEGDDDFWVMRDRIIRKGYVA
uniref:Uncharacterized protein n=1 Tax=Cerebratulus lacteus TaxID=6221 RepID=I0CL47_CERLA|nr:hypothetical protein [Cerebratulus lacteus]